MPGERGLNGDLSRFQVAGLTDHDSVRVLSKKGTQHARESQPDVFVYRDLHNSLEIVFDRFLRGKQFGIDRVDLAQTGVKRGRLTRTGRTVRDENSVGPVDYFENIIVDVIGHPEHLEIEVDRVAIEHAQNEAFAKLSRQSGNAKIDAAAGNMFFDPSILR